MTSILLREMPVPEMPVDHGHPGGADDTRLVELVMALSGCSARRALEHVRAGPEQSPLNRVAYALAALRADIATTARM